MRSRKQPIRKRRHASGLQRRNAAVRRSSWRISATIADVWAAGRGLHRMLRGVQTALRGFRTMLRHLRAVAERRLAIALLLTALGNHWAGAPLSAQAAAEVIRLTPAIAATAPSPTARGVFFTQQVDATLPARVRLAGTPDGSGELCTDDEAELRFEHVAGEVQVWRHLFASADRRGITCLPPQDLVLTAGGGSYRITLTLSDRFPDRFSSTAYYLVVAATPGTPPPPATYTPAALPTTTEAALPTPTVTSLPVLTPTLIPTALPTEPLEPASPAGSSGRPMEPWLTAGIGLVALLGLAVPLAWFRARRHAPLPQGIIDLYDRSTGESRTLLLYRYPQGAGIVREPLDLVEPTGIQATPLALITPTRTGIVLEQRAADATTQRTPLHVGETLLVDQVVEVRLRLR